MELTNQQLSNEVLKCIFDAAFITNEVSGDLLFLDDDIKFFVDWNQKQNRLVARTMFPPKDGASRGECLEFCNRVNADYIFVRAYVQADDDGDVWVNFEQDLPVYDDQTINAKTIVLFARQFQKLVRWTWKKAWGQVPQPA